MVWRGVTSLARRSCDPEVVEYDRTNKRRGMDRTLYECRTDASFPAVLPRKHDKIVYDQEVDTLNQAHEEQREEEKQNSEQKMNEVQVKISMDLLSPPPTAKPCSTDRAGLRSGHPTIDDIGPPLGIYLLAN